MGNFQLGCFIFTIGCLKFVGICAIIIAIAKVVGMLKTATGDSPILMGLIAVGVIALLTVIIKIKKSL